MESFVQIQNDYENLEKHVAACQKESESLDLELKKSQSQVEQVMESKQSLLMELESHKTKYQESQIELKEIQNRNLHLENECSRAFESIESQQKMVDSIDQVELQYKLLQQAHSNCKQEIGIEIEKNKQLSDTIKQLEDMIVSMDAQIVDLVDQIELSKKKMDYYEEKGDENESKMQELSTELDSLQQVNLSLVDKIQNQQNLLSELTRIQEQYSTCKNLELELENQLSRVASLTVEYDNLSKLFSVLKSELDSKDEQMHLFEFQFQQMKSDLEKTKLENQQFQSTIGRTVGTMESVEHAQQVQHLKNAKQNEKDPSKDKRIQEMESDLKQAESLLKRLEQETDILNGKLELEIQTKVELEKESLATITKLQYETAQQEQELIHTKRELQHVSDLLNSESNSKQELLDKYKKNCSLLDSNSIELSKRIQEIHDLKMDLEKKNVDLKKFEGEFALLEEQLKDLSLVQSNSTHSNSHSKDDSNSKDDTKDDSNDTDGEKEKQTKQLSLKESQQAHILVQDLKSEIGVAYEKISQLMMEKATREQEMEDLEIENQELNAKLKDLKVQMVELKENLRSMFPLSNSMN